MEKIFKLNVLHEYGKIKHIEVINNDSPSEITEELNFFIRNYFPIYQRNLMIIKNDSYNTHEKELKKMEEDIKDLNLREINNLNKKNELDKKDLHEEIEALRNKLKNKENDMKECYQGIIQQHKDLCDSNILKQEEMYGVYIKSLENDKLEIKKDYEKRIEYYEKRIEDFIIKINSIYIQIRMLLKKYMVKILFLTILKNTII